MTALEVQLVTIFPELFSSALEVGMLGKAVGTGRVRVGFVDPRELATDRRRSVDDVPYGGGAGMVLRADLVGEAIARARGDGGRVIVLTPRGERLSQRHLVRWSKERRIVLVSGRYEGIDERVMAHADEAISLGDFVLSGGEYAALAILDGVARLVPGVLGNAASLEEESFASGLLEHAQYTRPPELEGRAVPPGLLGGDHAEIAALRRAEALARTRRVRPDLLEELHLDAKDREALRAATPPRGRVSVVYMGLGDPTGLPVSAWARLVAAYALEAWIVVPPEPSRLAEYDGALAARKAELSLPPGPPAPRGRRAREAHERAEGERLAAWRAALGRIRADLGPPPGATPVGSSPEPTPEGRWDREALVGVDVALIVGADPPPGALVIPSVRAASSLRALGWIGGPAVLLDRLLGER